MRRSLITTIITALLALVLVSAANAAVPPGQQNWLNLDAGLQPRSTWLSNQAFRLKSIYNNDLLGFGNQTFGVDIHDYLQYGDETWGIDLVWNFHQVDQDYTEPPDYQPAPPGPQVAYVTLRQALNPSAMHERFPGHLSYQTYHQAVVDQIQNTSQYPISFVGWEYPAPDHCHGPVLQQGQILSGQQLNNLTRDQQGPRPYYDIKSCGAAGGGNGSAPLVRVTYHYVSWLRSRARSRAYALDRS